VIHTHTHTERATKAVHMQSETALKAYSLKNQSFILETTPC